MPQWLVMHAEDLERQSDGPMIVVPNVDEKKSCDPMLIETGRYFGAEIRYHACTLSNRERGDYIVIYITLISPSQRCTT